jgi:hypothetical protein
LVMAERRDLLFRANPQAIVALRRVARKDIGRRPCRGFSEGRNRVHIATPALRREPMLVHTRGAMGRFDLGQTQG